MKPSRAIISISAALAVTLLCAAGAVAKGVVGKDDVAQAAPSETAPVKEGNDFTKGKEWNKVGDSLKQAYLDAKKAGFPEQRLLCFIRSRDPIGTGDRSFLTSKGFIVQMVSGRTARGMMDPKDLPAVAGLYFVQKITMGKGQ